MTKLSRPIVRVAVDDLLRDGYGRRLDFYTQARATEQISALAVARTWVRATRAQMQMRNLNARADRSDSKLSRLICLRRPNRNLVYTQCRVHIMRTRPHIRVLPAHAHTHHIHNVSATLL